MSDDCKIFLFDSVGRRPCEQLRAAAVFGRQPVSRQREAGDEARPARSCGDGCDGALRRAHVAAADLCAGSVRPHIFPDAVLRGDHPRRGVSGGAGRFQGAAPVPGRLFPADCPEQRRARRNGQQHHGRLQLHGVARVRAGRRLGFPAGDGRVLRPAG